jgi:hypothetical protein
MPVEPRLDWYIRPPESRRSCIYPASYVLNRTYPQILDNVGLEPRMFSSQAPVMPFPLHDRCHTTYPPGWMTLGEKE